VSAGYKKTLYQACTFLEDGMWPPKRWEIEAVTYAFPPGYRENAEEEEEDD
jgi:hypothetical protein